jgi:hypothetical protein
MALAVFALSSPSWSQLTTLPTSGRLLGYAASPEPCGWLIIGPNNTDIEPVVSTDMRSVVFQGDAGSYIIVALVIKTLPDGKPIVSPLRKVLVLGGTVPPVPPPLPPGSKWILILEETGDRTAQMGNLLIAIRRQPELSKLVQILDKDAQAEYVKKILKAIPTGYTFPVIASVSSAGEPIRISPLKATDGIEKVKEFLK